MCFLDLALMTLLFAPNCAILTRADWQAIPITSLPAGATVTVNGRPQGATPLEIKLPRKKKTRSILIESAGYNPLEIRIKRAASPWSVLGDLAAGAAFGVGACLIYALATGEPMISTDPDAFVSDKLLPYAISAGMVGAVALDVGFGNVYTMKPTSLTVTLTKADGTPRVDTMVIDADDLQNIRWIRVHRDGWPADPPLPRRDRS
jgi:hypothetical protein